MIKHLNEYRSIDTETPQFKTIPIEWKEIDVEEEGVIEGYASTFGNVDLVGDRIIQGAFKRTIDNSKGIIPILSNHDPHKQIGWNKEAIENKKGLKVKGLLDIKRNEDAQRHHSLIKMGLELGAKPGLSIGYRVIKAEPAEDNPRVLELKELNLHEYSPVSFPANPKATAQAAKAWLKEIEGEDLQNSVEAFMDHMNSRGFQENEIIKALKKFLTESDNPTPEIGHLFEKGMMDLKSIWR